MAALPLLTSQAKRRHGSRLLPCVLGYAYIWVLPPKASVSLFFAHVMGSRSNYPDVNVECTVIHSRLDDSLYCPQVWLSVKKIAEAELALAPALASGYNTLCTFR